MAAASFPRANSRRDAAPHRPPFPSPSRPELEFLGIGRKRRDRRTRVRGHDPLDPRQVHEHDVPHRHVHVGALHRLRGFAPALLPHSEARGHREPRVRGRLPVAFEERLVPCSGVGEQRAAMYWRSTLVGFCAASAVCRSQSAARPSERILPERNSTGSRIFAQPLREQRGKLRPSAPPRANARYGAYSWHPSGRAPSPPCAIRVLEVDRKQALRIARPELRQHSPRAALPFHLDALGRRRARDPQSSRSIAPGRSSAWSGARRSVDGGPLDEGLADATL